MSPSVRHAALVALIASAHGCGRPPSSPTARSSSMEITGTLELDGRPLGDVALALVADDGRTVAVARSDDAGRFSLPRAAAPAAPATSWIVAKLQAPVVGAVAAPVPAGEATVALVASAAQAVTLTLDVELPPGAAPVDWYEVSVTPTALDGVPAPALRTLTLDGMGPARRNAYHELRVEGVRAELRVLPGTYDVRAAHIVDGPKQVPPPASWVSGGAALDDGRVIAADLEYVAVDVHRDTRLRVTMVPAHD
ncbi:MAG TPA: hypothetical protein VK932_03145 [Kofleriaceae bacterium]|nr:hypothetical protein [Kofleriaceae bacterium]